MNKQKKKTNRKKIFALSVTAFLLTLTFLELSIISFYTNHKTLLMMFSGLFGSTYVMVIFILLFLTIGYNPKK